MPLLPDEPETRAALAAHIGRLRHDLGKYVSMRQRWLGPDADPVALREALEADLLETRRGPDGVVDAQSVWTEFRGALLGEEALPGGARVDLRDDPDVQVVRDEMARLAAAADALRAGALDDPGVRAASASAFRVADACRALAQRVRGPEGGWPTS